MRAPLLLLVLGLGAQLTAQSFVTSPPGFLTRRAVDSAHGFGSDSFGRVMLFDGELRNARMSIKEVAYRSSARENRGRTWRNVSLRISDCDLSRLSRTFSANPTSTPTLVFSASVSWPSGADGSWNVRFPFRTPWSYLGTTDVCLDYDFDFGRLHGSSGPWWKHAGPVYAFDGYSQTIRGFARYSRHGGGCRNSRGHNSEVRVFLDSTGPALRYARNRNKYLFLAQVLTAPSATGFTVVGSGEIRGGVPFPGVACERLHLDPAKPFVMLPLAADSSGWSYTRFDGPFRAAYVGYTVHMQCAWRHTVTGQPRLTPAGHTTMPPQAWVFRRRELYNPDNVTKYGQGTWSSDPNRYSVITRYRY